MNIFGLTISRREAVTPAHLMVQQEKERRSVTASDAVRAAFGLGVSGSGIAVTEEGAMRIAAVYASVRVLAEDVASLPLKLYRRDGRSREAVPDHPLYRVLHDEGNDLMTAFSLRELVMVHMLLWGNHYSEKQFDGRGNLVGLWPMHPRSVEPKLDTSGPIPTVTYKVTMQDGRQVTLKRDQVFHVAGLGFDGILGKSPIQMHREALGSSIAAERYGAKFFRNDARPGGVLEHPGTLGSEGFENLRKSWTEVHQGVDNAHKIAILEEGMKYHQVGISPEDAQMIETLKYGVVQIARIFRVPPHKIADLERATYSNIEHQGLEYVTGSLRPWLVRIEQAIKKQLLLPQERGAYYAEHVVDGLLRGDIKSRYEAYTHGRNWGWFSANDIREMENLNPIPEGDIYLQPLNMLPAGSDPTKFDEGEGQRSERRSIETRASLPPRFSAAKSMEPVFRDAFQRIVRREAVEVRRAVGKYLPGDKAGFRSWLESFVEEHAEWMMPRIQPIYEMMAESMRTAAEEEIGGEVPADDLEQFTRDYSIAYANRHAGSTRGQIEALLDQDEPESLISQRLDEWEGEGENPARAEKDARRERQRSSNAFTKAAWALLGVSAVVWRNVGSQTCPYCTTLSGKRTSITSFFLTEGDSIQDLTVRTNIGHPPLHDGCDCLLVAGLGARKALTGAELRSVFQGIIEGQPLEHRHGSH